MNDAPWRTIYDHIRTLDVNDLVTYETLSVLLGYQFLENRQPFYRALKELEANDMHTMITVANVGYRIAEALEHEGVAKTRHKAGARKLRKSVSALRSADRSRMSPQEREKFDRMEMTASRNADMLRRLDGRITSVDQARKQDKREVKGDLANIQDQIDRLNAALRRRGADVVVTDT